MKPVILLASGPRSNLIFKELPHVRTVGVLPKVISSTTPSNWCSNYCPCHLAHGHTQGMVRTCTGMHVQLKITYNMHAARARPISIWSTSSHDDEQPVLTGNEVHEFIKFADVPDLGRHSSRTHVPSYNWTLIQISEIIMIDTIQ